jgi:PAS domain S-box-containing protein
MVLFHDNSKITTKEYWPMSEKQTSREHAQRARHSEEFSRAPSIEGELARSETRFRLLVEAVEDYALVMLDPDGHILCWNAGAARITGYSAEHIIGQHFAAFYSDEDRRAGRPEREMKAAADDGRWEGEVAQRCKDGHLFLAHVVITAVRDDAGKVLAFANVTQDITDRKRAEEEVHRLNHSLSERLNDLQDKIHQLEQFEEAVIGREFKMMELEKLTEQLREELRELKARLP